MPLFPVDDRMKEGQQYDLSALSFPAVVNIDAQGGARRKFNFSAVDCSKDPNNSSGSNNSYLRMPLEGALLSKGDIPYLLHQPIRAVLRHSFNRWKGENALKAPLISTDHQALAVLSFVWGGWFGAMLGSTPVTATIGAFFFGGFVGINLGEPHIREARYGASVVRNAHRFNAGSIGNQWDKKLLKLVKEFKESTGWSIAWSRDPYLLAKAEPDSRRLILNIGWITESDDPSDHVRLPYLKDTLRRIRHVIK